MTTPDLVHNRSRYRRLAVIIRADANANPNARCWRCGRTLAQHPPHKDGRRPTWTAGHRTDGQLATTLTLADLGAEASTCNFEAGARRTNAIRNRPTSRDW